MDKVGKDNDVQNVEQLAEEGKAEECNNNECKSASKPEQLQDDERAAEECSDHTKKGEMASPEVHCVVVEHSGIKKKIKNLEQRVVALEASLSAALGGIPHILAELRAIKKHVSGHSGAKAADGIPPNNIAEACKGAGSPAKSAPHSAAPTDSGRETSVKDPVYVDTETPTESGDYTDEGSPCLKRNRIATRVHSNPRLRAKPFEGRIIMTSKSPSKGGVVTVGPPGGGQSREIRYRNPPGHVHETDFGPTPAPKVKLPALKPSKHSVSASHISVSHKWISVCVCLQFVTPGPLKIC